jgi:transglutaminase-like putative cysteine protease
MNYHSPVITETISSLKLENLTQKEQAIKIFYFVRDSIRYSISILNFDAKIFKASWTLQQDTSFCIPKAIALSALTRAVGIPSRIHLVDFVNHRLSESLAKAWGTNIMAAHCYSELYINNKWVKATPALDIKICERHDFIPVEFDGENDGLLKPVDKKGRPHAEYIKDHGTFPDLPLPLIMSIFEENYGPITPKRLPELFLKSKQTFQET